MVKLATIYKQLNVNDFKILLLLDKMLVRYEYVPLEVIEKYTGFNPKELELRLGKLHRLKLIRKNQVPYLGYQLTYMGLDCLALKSLADRNIVKALGDKIGVGKESDIYLGLDPNNERVIVKFYRIGRTSFRQTQKVRTYVPKPTQSAWLIQSKISAEREFKALIELFSRKGYVPKPIGWSRHTVVIEYLEGIELFKVKILEDPYQVLKKILETIKIAYMDVGIVHGDLSEYNVMVVLRDDNEVPLIIDWPQYVYKDHPSANSLLLRDITYVVRYFRRRFKLSVNMEKAIKFVKGEISEF